MERKPVPYLNQDIEIPLIMHIIRKNILGIIAFLIILFLASFLYLRYTTPRYESSTVIQLTSEEADLNFFEESKMGNTNIAQDIELLRSPVFLQRTIDSLPLEVTYYKEGRILDFDNYNMAPYQVEVKQVSPLLYRTPVYIKFTSGHTYDVRYKIGKEKFEYSFDTRLKQEAPHFSVNVSVLDSIGCVKPTNPMYFVFNRPDDILEEFSKRLKIQVESEAARTIKIIFTDVNPVRASEAANMIAKEFEYFNIEKKREGADKIINYIDDKINIVKLNLNEADSSLTSYKQKFNIVDKKDEDNSLEDKNIELLRQLENQKFDYEIQLLVLKDVIKNVTKPELDIYAILTQISQLKSDAYINGIVANINQLITKRDKLKQTVTENNRELRDVNDQIETQRRLLITSLQAIKESVDAKISELNKKTRTIEGSFGSGNHTLPDQVEYIQRKRIFEVNQTYYDLLIKKRVEYEVLSEGYTSGYRVLKYSAPAKAPVYPRRMFTLIVVLLIWLVVTFVFLTVKYLLHDKVLGIEHITRYCDVSVLGVVSKYKNDIPVSQLIVDKNPKSMIAEAFRTIRSNLDFISNKPGSKLIAITSTISGEGKTFVSINLAGILAFTGKKVIIIDADMRKPKIHVGFNVSNEKGLSNLLILKNTLEESIQQSSLENLHFITAGPIPPNPSELLLSDQMNILIDTLLEKYDYVLVDNPPVGIVTDALSILKKADYPIYVFRAGVSRKFFVNNLQKLIIDSKIKHLSVVLNGVEIKKSNRYGYGYGNYGYDGTGYGYYEEEDRKLKKRFPGLKK